MLAPRVRHLLIDTYEVPLDITPAGLWGHVCQCGLQLGEYRVLVRSVDVGLRKQREFDAVCAARKCCYLLVRGRLLILELIAWKGEDVKLRTGCTHLLVEQRQLPVVLVSQASLAGHVHNEGYAPREPRKLNRIAVNALRLQPPDTVLWQRACRRQQRRIRRRLPQ